jgi:hypothetical protein
VYFLRNKKKKKKKKIIDSYLRLKILFLTRSRKSNVKYCEFEYNFLIICRYLKFVRKTHVNFIANKKSSSCYNIKCLNRLCRSMLFSSNFKYLQIIRKLYSNSQYFTLLLRDRVPFCPVVKDITLIKG